MTAKQDKQREDTAANEYEGETGSGDEAEDASPAPEERTDNISAEREEAVAIWYSSKGKNQLNRIIASLHSRGIYECWIRKDGICNFRSDRGYRRAGIYDCKTAEKRGIERSGSGKISLYCLGRGISRKGQTK